MAVPLPTPLVLMVPMEITKRTVETSMVSATGQATNPPTPVDIPIPLASGQSCGSCMAEIEG